MVPDKRTHRDDSLPLGTSIYTTSVFANLKILIQLKHQAGKIYVLL